jgi:hypothetical protein
MQSMTVERGLGVLGWLAVVLFVGVGVGVAELVLDGEETFRSRLAFLAVLCVFAVIVYVGVRVIPSRAWPGAALASVGAILGGFALFWTVLAIPLAVAIVVLSVVSARRHAQAAA